MEPDWVGSTELGGTRLFELVQKLGEFVFSLITCGLSDVADDSVVRVLILVNMGMEVIGLPMGLLPLHFFYFMSPNPQRLASEQMLLNVVRSFADHLIAEENARRGREGLPSYTPSRTATIPPAPLPKKLRVAFCGFDLLISAPTPGLLGRSLQYWNEDRYECWLVVRSLRNRSKGGAKRCLKPRLCDFDPGFGPGRELWSKFQGRILCIYSGMSDEECATAIYNLGFHVFFHVNGYNLGHFYRSLLMIMDKTETVYIEMLSMASPLQSTDLAHFNTGREPALCCTFVHRKNVICGHDDFNISQINNKRFSGFK